MSQGGTTPVCLCQLTVCYRTLCSEVTPVFDSRNCAFMSGFENNTFVGDKPRCVIHTRISLRCGASEPACKHAYYIVKVRRPTHILSHQRV